MRLRMGDLRVAGDRLARLMRLPFAFVVECRRLRTVRLGISIFMREGMLLVLHPLVLVGQRRHRTRTLRHDNLLDCRSGPGNGFCIRIRTVEIDCR
ncbi:hypothetical protein U875_26085 [Pandoraea pnomenusa 3kgm]|nr:hypothetical protein U875_26085 [Pandoraea pnomenusa 3kgm]